MEHQRRHVVVRGVVQGVGFRNFTQTQAMSLDIRGWVRNLPDGSVEAVIEGAPEVLDELVKRLGAGPRMATVTDVLVREDLSTDVLNGFVLKR